MRAVHRLIDFGTGVGALRASVFLVPTKTPVSLEERPACGMARRNARGRLATLSVGHAARGEARGTTVRVTTRHTPETDAIQFTVTKLVLSKEETQSNHANMLISLLTILKKIKKVYIQSFRTISENQCLLQMLNDMEIRRRIHHQSFPDSTDIQVRLRSVRMAKSQ
ncbi:hypothetical protein Tco_0205171 [Tanacetum coccineum]